MVRSSTVSVELTTHGVIGKDIVGYTLPSGYTPILAIGVSDDWYGTVQVRSFTTNNVPLALINNYIDTQTVHGHAEILCIRTGFFS